MMRTPCAEVPARRLRSACGTLGIATPRPKESIMERDFRIPQLDGKSIVVKLAAPSDVRAWVVRTRSGQTNPMTAADMAMYVPAAETERFVSYLDALADHEDVMNVVSAQTRDAILAVARGDMEDAVELLAGAATRVKVAERAQAAILELNLRTSTPGVVESGGPL